MFQGFDKMTDQNQKGITQLLTNRDIPWTKRVKLIRYSWVNDAVVIPNKKPFLLHSVITALVSRRKELSADDVSALWRCSQDVLQAACRENVKNASDVYSLKTGFVQLVLAELQQMASSTCIDETHTSTVISCCHSLVSCTILGLDLTSKFENMLKLLTSVLQLLLRSYNGELRNLREILESLLVLSVPHYAVCLRQNLHHSRWLLTSAQNYSFCMFSMHTKPAKVHLKSQIQNFANVYWSLKTVWLQLFSQRELLPHYSAFLQRKVGKAETGWKESRYISVLFETVMVSFRDEKTRQAAIEGILWIYSKFTSSYREKNVELPLLLLRYVTETFSVGESLFVADENGTSVTSEVHEKNSFGRDLLDERLRVLHLLLETTLLSNIFDVVYDISNGNKMLRWFQAVSAWLLQQKNNRCKDWFDCMRNLLLLAAATVESRLIALINVTWTMDSVTLSYEAQQAQDALLVEIVRVFSRMRQMGKLMHAMLLAIRSAERRVNIGGSFVDSLRSSFAELDPMTVIDIWQEINKDFSSEYDNSSSKHLDRLKVEAFCELTSTFILNITAVGHSITQAIESKFSSLLLATCEQVLSLLQNLCLKKNSVDGVCSLINLLHACGEMIIVRQAYGDATSKGGISQPSDRSFNDLSSLHPAWEYKQWLKFHNFVTASGNKQLLLCWERLILQALQFDRCCYRVTPQPLLQHINDFLLFEDHWVSATAEVNETAAHWSNVLANVNLLLPVSAPNTHVEAVAKFLLDVWTSPATETDTRLLDVANNFMVTPTFLEMSGLHACLLQYVVKRILQCFAAVNSSKVKRRKHSNDYEHFHLAVKLLGNLNDSLAIDENGTLVIPSEVVDALDALFDLKEFTFFTLCEETSMQLVTLVKFLKQLPLEFMDVSTQVKCILCLIIMLAATATFISDRNRQTVQNDALKVLHCMLFDGQGMHALMKSLNPGSVLRWFLAVQQQLMIQNDGSIDLLRSCDDVLRRVVRLSTKHSTMIAHLTNLVHCIKQQFRDVRKSNNDPQTMKFTFRVLSTVLEVITKVLRRPYLRPENHAAFCSINDSITREFSKSLAGLEDGTPTSAVSTDDEMISSGILLGYSCQVEYSLLQRDPKVEEESASVKDKIMKFLPVMCVKCIHHLQLSENLDVINSCLRFIIVMCSCHDGVKDHLPAGFLSEIWPLVISRLRRKVTVQPDSTKSDKPYQLVNSERSYLETALAAVIGVVETHDLQQHLEELISDMESGECARTVAAMQVYCRMMTIVAQYPKDAIKAVLPTCRKVLLITRRLLTMETSDHLIVNAALNVTISMLSASWTDDDRIRAVVTPSMLSLCLHPCAAVESLLPNSDVESFVGVCHSWHGLLNAVLIYHSPIVYRMIPAYVGGVRQMLRAVMHAGSQPTDAGHHRYTDRQLDQIIDCARLFDRLSSLMCCHKINFAKVAPYLIADYVNMAQKMTLYPAVKRTLLLAVYKLLDICNEHSIRQLNAILPPGAREVFRLVYANFDKYYRYSRRAASEDQRNVEFIRAVYNS